jgi:co-chaperonin GroES (HSP10)
MTEKMVPRGDYLYVRPFIETYEGKLIKPDKFKQVLTFGTVLARGPKVLDDVKVGSVVYYSSWAGIKFDKNKTDSVIQLRDGDILSIKDEVNGVEVTVGEVGMVRER